MKRWTKWLIAVLAMLVTAAPCALAGGYGYGDEAEEIAQIQTALEELDFYYTDITGHYGKRTQSAVSKFQKRYGLPQTGVADEKTMELLFFKAGMDAPAFTQTALPEQDYGTVTLREGSRSDAVRMLQENLTLLDYYTGDITGNYGRLTKEAVRRFQRANDLSSDGVAGPQTFAALEEILTDKKPQGQTTDSPQGADAVQEEEKAQTNTGVSLKNVGKLNTERTLRITSRSGYVTRMQTALYALGYYTGKVDGCFGKETEAAVRAYQLARGLTVDGVAGRATLRSINSDVESGVTASQTGND